MPTTLPPRLLHIFGDESSHKGNHKFLVYGTVSCERERLPKIVAELEAASKGRNLEWKWSGNHHRALYPEFVDAIMRSKNQYGLRFRCLVVNTRHSRHGEYNNSDADLGLEKYIFFHLLSYARQQKAEARFFVQLDERTKKYTSESQRISLNHRDRAENGRTYELFAELSNVNSTSSRLVQAADVLSGAVAYVVNERYLMPQANAEKRALAERVARGFRVPIVGPAKRLGIQRGDLRSLAFETLPNLSETSGFNSWHLHLRAKEEDEIRAKSRDQLSRYRRDQTFGEIAAEGNQLILECARCDHRHNDYLSANPNFSKRRISEKPLPPCGKCGRNGIVYLATKRQR